MKIRTLLGLAALSIGGELVVLSLITEPVRETPPLFVAGEFSGKRAHAPFMKTPGKAAQDALTASAEPVQETIASTGTPESDGERSNTPTTTARDGAISPPGL